MKIPKLLQFVILVVVSYAIFRAPQLFEVPIPGSLILMYMFFAVVMMLLVLTATEESAKELFAPIKALVTDPAKAMTRNVVFALVPLVFAWITYNQVKPSFEAPVEIRSTHPAPPSTLKGVFKKSYNMMTLENPFRKIESEDPERFKELVKEGGVVYFQNCFYCHGDKLDGKGHYGQGFLPAPLPFQGINTIAQLQESFVFWRITTGGPGLPKEATPWKSAMPIWQNFLTEDEVWKAILFIYDYTDNVPRSWE